LKEKVTGREDFSANEKFVQDLVDLNDFEKQLVIFPAEKVEDEKNND